MHDPVCFLAAWGPTLVEHEGFPHADEPGLVVDGLVPPGCFPEPGDGRSVGPRPGRIFLVFVTEEVPLVLLFVPYPTSLCPLY